MNQEVDSPSAERRQLILRAGVAGALIVALLAGLLIFEGKPDEEPANDAPSRTVTGPGSSIGDKSPPSIADSPDAPDVLRSGQVADEQSAPSAEASAAVPESVSAPVGVPESTTDPAVGSALGVPGLDAGRPAQATAPASAPRLILQAGEQPRSAPRAAASAPATATVPAPAPAPAAARPGSGFVVQVGVFANPANAQDIVARLKASGIPAQVETRVNLGPFRTREEALAAQQKLTQLGLGKGMLIAPRK